MYRYPKQLNSRELKPAEWIQWETWHTAMTTCDGRKMMLYHLAAMTTVQSASSAALHSRPTAASLHVARTQCMTHTGTITVHAQNSHCFDDCYAGYVHSSKSNTSDWCLSVCSVLSHRKVLAFHETVHKLTEPFNYSILLMYKTFHQSSEPHLHG